MADHAEQLAETPLASLHRERGARMVPFAGFSLPLHYPAGILAEHLHTRAAAALFDVSHMGQATVAGPGAIAALERLVTADLAGLAPGRQRYALLTDDAGGILDDLIVGRTGPDEAFLVVNAARRDVDFTHIAAHLPAGVTLRPHPDRALLALQGPQSATVLARLAPEAAGLAFMQAAELPLPGIGPARIARCGYTGEDGFEIAVAAEAAEPLARRLLAEPEVAPAGLGARDSLRLEAGLPLHGADIDAATTPVEAGLAWAIGKRRAWDFPGAAVIRAQMQQGAPRRRVGLRPESRAPARAGTAITTPEGAPIGTVTSGGFGPTIGGPIAMGTIAAAHASPGTPVALLVRGTALPARVVALPFVPHRYFR